MFPPIFQCGFLFIHRVKIKKWLYGCMAARFFSILLIKLKVFILSDCSIFLWRKADHKQWQQSLFITIVTNLLVFNSLLYLFILIFLDYWIHVLILILENILFHEFISLYYLICGALNQLEQHHGEKSTNNLWREKQQNFRYRLIK